MKFNNKENECTKTADGRTIWVSRSAAVVGGIFVEEGDKLWVVAGKRGERVTHSGLWSLPCGYLDWGETLEEAMSREAWEETGSETSPDDWSFFRIESDPNKFRQNVSIQFFRKTKEPRWELTTENCEPGEVVEVKWIDTREILNYNWAFDHEKRIVEMILKFS